MSDILSDYRSPFAQLDLFFSERLDLIEICSSNIDMEILINDRLLKVLGE